MYLIYRKIFIPRTEQNRTSVAFIQSLFFSG
jgi:hypothetical protein